MYEYVYEYGQKSGANASPHILVHLLVHSDLPFRRPLVYLTAMTVPKGGRRMYLS